MSFAHQSVGLFHRETGAISGPLFFRIISLTLWFLIIIRKIMLYTFTLIALWTLCWGVLRFLKNCVLCEGWKESLYFGFTNTGRLELNLCFFNGSLIFLRFIQHWNYILEKSGKNLPRISTLLQSANWAFPSNKWDLRKKKCGWGFSGTVLLSQLQYWWFINLMLDFWQL